MTPLTAVHLARIYKQAGVPDGVFNVLQGAGDVGRMLVSEPAIRKVSLTGEVGTGRRVMAGAAETLKYVTLELGGKSPLIIFEDADIDNAVSAAMLANFYSAGEICSNGTRVFVHVSIRDRFLAALKERVEKIRVGEPLDPDTQMGSLISQGHMEKVLAYIEIGKQEGARLLTGRLPCAGRRAGARGVCSPDRFLRIVWMRCASCRKKFLVLSWLLPILSRRMKSLRVPMRPFLVWRRVCFSADLTRAHRVIHQLEAGTCWINTYNITPIELPFGGYKQSGLGRENSRLAVEHYTQVKSVYVALGGVDAPY
ncbi:MAG: aldehyde dehydrogenase family protein [Acetobacter peroxydans]|nr:aldehyde dehydrogenase family protein [Acetobacter peroxydans]